MSPVEAAQTPGSVPTIDWVLSHNPFFAGLGPELRRAVAQAFEHVKVQERHVVIAEGHAPDSFFILVQGELHVVRAGGLQETAKKQGVLRPFDFFGFKSLFDDQMRAPSTLLAHDQPCLLYELTRARFDELMRAHPELTLAMLPVLASHVPDATSPDAYVISNSGRSTPDEGAEPAKRVLPADPRRFVIKVFDAKQYQVKYLEEQNSAGGFNYKLEFIEEKLTPETARAGIARGAHAVCVFVHDDVTEEVARILKSQGVELVALRCAGMDAVDLKACEAEGVSVVRVPGYSPNAIAEHAVAMMMALNRKLVWANARVHGGDFSLDGLVGFDMKGKTAGVVGTGKIGACLVAILLGFGCRVICYDVYKNPALVANPAVQYVELEQLLQESDIISLHAPLMPSTQHMINAKSIAQMKRGVMLINTSRGPLIDTAALIDGLKSGKIGACGLDVVEGENAYFYSDHSEEVMANDQIARLLACNNVILTAHQAFLTQEALREIASCTLRNVAEFHQGKRMKGLTNSAI